MICSAILMIAAAMIPGPQRVTTTNHVQHIPLSAILYMRYDGKALHLVNDQLFGSGFED